MAQRITFTSVWTVVVTVLAALLSALGLRGKAAAPAVVGRAAAPAIVGKAAAPSVAVGDAPSRCRSVGVCPPGASRSRRAVMRSGALPPTIKQRIRAEVHGRTPSVRRSAAAAAARAGEGAPTGAAARIAASVPDAVAAAQVRLRFALAA
ncbi:hypothetical protein HYE82_10690 [Streptomyces sp. BR123]|uniref:DUF6344 domain-containing protein n=1 Tax=Streptomyces sp. BR123 TaxID=2749828 RepID=UPI0015C48A7D|nr:DUF6344 domain-containing protein [Streptomyces sp. BR123]NXY94852.1 hypothetical protein [Streptomyces sp. BR123]